MTGTRMTGTDPRDRVLTGWGRTAPSRARVERPDGAEDVDRLLGSGRSVIARGLGRSYGDAAQCAGGVVVDTAGLSSVGTVDAGSGTVEVGGGTPLSDVLRHTLQAGWFVGAVPGTSRVTVGGAIAADVHGKNHHRDGGFCSFVDSVTLATPTGTHVVGPDRDPDLFWATAGGMGLTGIVTKATLRLVPVETPWMRVDTERFAHLDDLMAAMSTSDGDYRYSVAWLDLMAPGRRRGRAVLARGDHAPRGPRAPATLGRRRSGPGAHPRLRRPLRLPASARHAHLAPGAVRALNAARFGRSPRHETGRLQPWASFFHPLDRIENWNLLYGRRGLLQYQFVVGPSGADLVGQAVALAAAHRVPCFLAVLKRMGPRGPGPLSFPMPGWTLALDFPVGPPGLPGLLDRLDELVAEAGGRVYLAKDCRLRPELLAAMYPRLAELEDVRRRVDPRRVLRSDLSRRLGLDG
ncbi:MAG TPA: FAD-binding oxidoreductase [Acidimicrobiales bacterium]|nr:FAD-binding oxidoreductase [Acidimicrobiales bacterium]